MERVVEHRVRSLGWGARLSLPAIVFLAAGHARAGDVEWSNTNGGAFEVGGNWIGGVVPGAGDFARFGRTRNPNQQQSYMVSFSSNPTNLGVVIEDDQVTFDLNSQAHILTSASTPLTVGTSQVGSGRLTITDGAVVLSAPNPNAFIGNNGNTGSLIISTGGQLFGPNLWVGAGGPGSLTIQGGGDFVGLDLLIGGLAGGTGSAGVTGSGSVALVDGVVGVGVLSSGSLSVSSGARVESTNGVVAQNASIIGTVSVNGAGSVWGNATDLNVGDSGDGSLSITDGGRVVTETLRVARLAGSSTVSVTGTGSRLEVGNRITVGGHFELEINGGAGTLFIGPGGTVQARTILIYPNDVVDLDGGTLEVDFLGRRLDPTGQFRFHSGILSAIDVTFGVVNEGGTLTPRRAGFTVISGSYTQQAAAELEIDIGDSKPPLLDSVFIDGLATLGGRLEIRLTHGHSPSPEETYMILDAGGITGAFANAANGQRLGISDGTGSFIVNYGPSSPFDPDQVFLSDFRLCIADFNRDGVVNLFDYLAYQTAFGNAQAPADLAAPFGTFNLFDYLAFQTAFGNGC